MGDWIGAQEYERAIKAFRAESRKFRQAQQDYRARKIHDREFLLAKSEFEAAAAIADHAEREFIKANEDRPERA